MTVGAPDAAEAARAAELAALKRPFLISILAIVAVIVALGGVVAAFGTPADRPAGIAERWLVAVGDSTREGIEEDALDRAQEHGAGPDLAARAGLLPADAAADGERSFEDVRVGRSETAGVSERVSFTVTPYESEPVEGYVYLQKVDDGWQVLGLQRAGDPAVVLQMVVVGLDLGPVPTERPDIERPERAPIGFFVGAIGLGVLITFGCSAAVRAATPKP